MNLQRIIKKNKKKTNKHDFVSQAHNYTALV